MITPRRMLTTEEAIAEARKTDEVLNSVYQGAKDVVSPVADFVMYYPGKLIGGLDKGVEMATGVSPLEYNERVGEGMQGMLLNALSPKGPLQGFSEGYSGTPQDIKGSGSLFLDNLGSDFLNFLNPIDVVSGGAVGVGKRFLDTQKKSLGDDLVPSVASSPDNFLPGYYGSFKDKNVALSKFIVDSFESSMKSLSPEAIKTYKETGYNPVMIKKVQSFVKNRQEAVAEVSRLTEVGKGLIETYGNNSPQVKEHKKALRAAGEKASAANRQVEAQIQHGTYIALRAGVKPDDLPPLYKQMLDKMSVNASGANPLGFDTYFDIVKDYKGSSTGPTGRVINQRKNVAQSLFNKALANWGIKDPDKFTMVVRQSDDANPFNNDVSKIATQLNTLFPQGKSFKTVDDLYTALKNKQKTNQEFVLRGIGLQKGEKGGNVVTIRGRQYNADDVAIRKSENGVFLSIKGNPKFSPLEVQRMAAEENARRVEANKVLEKENTLRKEKGLGPVLDSKKEPKKPKPLLKLREKEALYKKYGSGSGGVKSTSFLEGGVNIEVHITPDGKMTTVISDDYNFLENILPSLEESFDKKILGITPPIKVDLRAGKFKDTKQPSRTIKGQKRMSSQSRDEYVTQLDLEGGDKVPAQLQGGLYGLVGLLADTTPTDDQE